MQPLRRESIQLRPAVSRVIAEFAVNRSVLGIRALIAGIAIAAGYIASAQQAPSEPGAPLTGRTSAMMCGPFAIWCLASLCDVKVDKDTILAMHPSHPEGLSLSEVQERCGEIGLPVAVRKLTLDELFDQPRPVIALTRWHEDSSHYVVVLSASPDEMRVFEPTTAKIVDIVPHRFPVMWDGYTVVPLSAWERARVPVAIGVLCLGAVTAAVYGIRGRASGKPARGEGATRA